MTARWFVAKYIPDLRRREPLNVGVLLVGADGLVSMRFIGERGRLPKFIQAQENFRSWVRYWESLSSAEEIVAEVKSRRGDANYIIEPGGEALRTERTSRELLDHLFELVVARHPAAVAAGAPTVDRADEIFASLHVSVDRDVMVPITDAPGGNLVDEVHFDYRYTNGHVRLMRFHTLRGTRASWDRVHSMQHSFERVQRADLGVKIATPIALVLPRDEGRAVEAQHRLLAQAGVVVDLSDMGAATVQLKKLLLNGHSPPTGSSGGGPSPGGGIGGGIADGLDAALSRH